MADNHKKMDKTNEVVSITLGTVGALDVIGAAGQPMTQNGFTTSTTILALLTGLTAGEGEGLCLGVADGQLSDAEIEAALESAGPVFKGQRAQSELSGRMVRLIGLVGPQPTELVAVGTQFAHFWDRWPTRIAFSEDKPAMHHWFVYNASPAALTTGATLRLVLLHNIRWAA